MEQIPDQQHAWVNIRRGKPSEALEYRTDWPVAKDLDPGEVLVKVQAGALNPVGHKLMKLLPNFLANRPRVVEFDLAGIVAKSNGSRFKVGDEVFGWVRSDQVRGTKEGALSQYAKVKEDWLALRPTNISAEEAAGCAVTGLSAYYIVVKLSDLQAGQRIFVNGGSTSVGVFAIQMAKSRGVHVTASASAKNEQFVRNLGAEEFVDYTSVNLTEYLKKKAEEDGRKFDYIFELVGLNYPELYTRSNSYLSPMGGYVTVGPQPKGLGGSELLKLFRTTFYWVWPRALGGLKASFNIVRLDLEEGEEGALEQLRKMITEGKVKPVVDSIFDFKDALQGYDKLVSQKVAGKVVVRVNVPEH